MFVYGQDSIEPARALAIVVARQLATDVYALGLCKSVSEVQSFGDNDDFKAEIIQGCEGSVWCALDCRVHPVLQQCA